jgi:hypothetical protein
MSSTAINRTEPGPSHDRGDRNADQTGWWSSEYQAQPMRDPSPVLFAPSPRAGKRGKVTA